MPTTTTPAQDALALTVQNIGVSLVAVIAVVVVHEFILQCRSILLPFVLSGFIVLSVEPYVNSIYGYMAGHLYPHRWCLCCCQRRLKPHQRRAQGELPAPNVSRGDGNDSDGQKDSGGESANESSSDSWWSDSAEEREPLPGDRVASVQFLQWSVTHAVDGVMRFVAAVIVLAALLLILAAFVTMLVRGALHMRDNFEAYKLGVNNMVVWLDKATQKAAKPFGTQADKAVMKIRGFYSYLLSRMQDAVEVLVDAIVSMAYGGLTTFFMVLLYMLFWFLRPLPIGGQAGVLVRSYIWKKTLVSFLYACCVSVLFYFLHDDLALFFGMMAFFLNYVPEVGAFISILLPVPVILLDGRLKSPVASVAIAIMGQLLLKVIINNVLEVKLVEMDREMSIHPVWVLLGLNYFGYVWGPVGMLISVPMMALLKSALLSKLAEPSASSMALEWAEVTLDCLEGRAGKKQWRRMTLKNVVAKMSVAGPTGQYGATRSTIVRAPQAAEEVPNVSNREGHSPAAPKKRPTETTPSAVSFAAAAASSGGSGSAGAGGSAAADIP